MVGGVFKYAGVDCRADPRGGEMVGVREEHDSLDTPSFTLSAQIPLSLFNSLFLISSCTPVLR